MKLNNITRTVAIMQPYLFPYIGYFQLLTAADYFIVYDDVSYIKGGWINRNKLLVNGQPWMFTIPLDQPSPNRMICDIALQPRPLWQPKFLRTVAQNYGKASQFAPIYALLEQIFTADAITIADLVRVSLSHFVAYLALPVTLVPTSAAYANSCLRAQDRVLDICRQEGASHYVNAQGGRNLYNTASFGSAGINLKFIKPYLPAYPQLGKQEFIAGLSIIDVLMNNDREAVRSLLQAYTLESN